MFDFSSLVLFFSVALFLTTYWFHYRARFRFSWLACFTYSYSGCMFVTQFPMLKPILWYLVACSIAAFIVFSLEVLGWIHRNF